MIIVIGDLLTTPVKFIAHQVNCQGVMGAGVALQIKRQYPGIMDSYAEFINDYKECNDEPPLGKYHLYDTKDFEKHIIVNIFGQNQYGCSQNYTNYGALYDAFADFHDDLVADGWIGEEGQLVVAIPYKMGCGLAGGDWEVVYKLLTKLEFEYNFLFICYKLP